MKVSEMLHFKLLLPAETPEESQEVSQGRHPAVPGLAVRCYQVHRRKVAVIVEDEGEGSVLLDFTQPASSIGSSLSQPS